MPPRTLRREADGRRTLRPPGVGRSRRFGSRESGNARCETHIRRRDVRFRREPLGREGGDVRGEKVENHSTPVKTGSRGMREGETPRPRLVRSTSAKVCRSEANRGYFYPRTGEPTPKESHPGAGIPWKRRHPSKRRDIPVDRIPGEARWIFEGEHGPPSRPHSGLPRLSGAGCRESGKARCRNPHPPSLRRAHPDPRLPTPDSRSFGSKRPC